MILEVKELHKHFQGRGRPARHPIRALDGISFSLARGESLGIVGESGCGKTTLTRCLLRLMEPTAGTIRFRQRNLLALSGARLRRQRRLLQAVFQDPGASLNPRMPVGRIVEEPLAIHRLGNRRQRQRRVEELLARVGLEGRHAGRYPLGLSGGQRQRVALARALATDPELLVADEPLASLDLPVQLQIAELLGRLHAELQLTLLFVSHALPAVRRLCQRVAIMHKGRFLEMAPTAEIFERPLHPHTRELLGAIPRLPSAGESPGRSAPTRSRTSFTMEGPLREVSPGHWVRPD